LVNIIIDIRTCINRIWRIIFPVDFLTPRAPLYFHPFRTRDYKSSGNYWKIFQILSTINFHFSCLPKATYYYYNLFIYIFFFYYLLIIYAVYIVFVHLLMCIDHHCLVCVHYTVLKVITDIGVGTGCAATQPMASNFVYGRLIYKIW